MKILLYGKPSLMSYIFKYRFLLNLLCNYLIVIRFTIEAILRCERASFRS